MGFNSFTFADEVVNSLLGNLGTLSVGNATLNLWTDATADLTKAWTTNNPNGTEIKAQIQYLLSQHGNTKAMADFLNPYLTAGSLNSFDSQDITELLQALSQNYDTTAGSTQMTEIQQFGNLVSSTDQIETATGTTESQAQSSFISQTTSAPQTIADLGGAGVGIMTALAGLLNQGFL